MEKRKELIDYIIKNGKKESWFELALLFNIKPNASRDIRTKAANDVWRTYQRKLNRNGGEIPNHFENNVKDIFTTRPSYINLPAIETAKALWKILPENLLPNDITHIEQQLEIIKQIQVDFKKAKVIKLGEDQKQLINIYNDIVKEKENSRKKLFFDIETSPNVVFSWRIGSKVNLSHDNIINERAIICVSYKWEGEDKVYSLAWDKGCDKELLEKFSKIIDSADEIVTQNGDKFDIKWLRARCIFHDIPISPKFNSIDTLKMARAGFNFNSNKLDYMGSYLGVGQKIHTGYDLWKNIVLHNNGKALKQMIEYCEEDVRLLERVYNKLKPYSPVKRFKYITK